jgi:14-3-3 protein epsilon
MQPVNYRRNKFLTLFLLLSVFFTMSEPNISLDGLSLSDEGLTLNLDTDPSSIQILEHCLIGRVLTDKQIRFSYFKERLSHVWKPGKKVTILQSEEGRYLFQFNHRLDAAKVLDEGPWLFDNFNLVIERIAPGVVPATVELNHLDVWLQVYRLPFGFIQPKVGQTIGRFLGEMKEYDHRNTVHSTYMRLKVRINVTKPLQQSWKVRANEGNFVQIIFKYEKLGIFCYLCGLLGHTDKNCPKLFDMDHDDGSRGWSESIRPLTSHQGTSATNKYIKDPIPSRPHAASANNAGTKAAPVSTFHQAKSAPFSGNLDGRIVAVQKEISAIKSGILIAQKHAMVKAGKLSNEASSSLAAMLPSATPQQAVSTTDQQHSAAFGLLPEAPTKGEGTDLLCLEFAEGDDSGVELKKRKRAKAVKDQHSEITMCSGVVGLETVVTRQGNGTDDVMFIDNPMYDANNVTAGPDDQACREP